MKYIFFPSLYILEKKISLLANVRNKCVIRKINLYFFDARKNDQIVPSKVCYFQYDHRIFFKNWECVNRYVLKNVLNLDCHDSICFGIFQVA